MSLSDELQAHIQAFPGQVGVWLEHLSSGETFAHQPQRPFLAASTIKLPMLCYALATRADLSQNIPIKPEVVALGSGVLKDLSPGLVLPLRDLLTLMIVLSDNTATNVVLDHWGHKEPFNAYYRAQGWSQTHVAGMLSLPEDRPDPRRLPGDAAKTSAQDLGRLLKALWRGELLPPDATKTALDILSRQQFTAFLRYLLADLDDLEERTTPIRLYSKSGEIRCCRHDTGILARGEQALSITVLTETETDPRFHPDHPATLLIGRIAEVAYRYWLAG
ncbi:serine hydrolase [Meiothermus granaticius]|uniref:Beta-lactamase enzyme family protein n=1 Tax=Meiothermus granaticius NBRC 107808 TaxID=1227551 RepID=A0A399FBQ7_9DEIN|nr:serine hydrolase [Meiothermus granaticius]RIH94034.1 Beta-lactamase enzyme family protein [Meiothermus granaticius NBRC 107808]GEM88488.1 serine hydrolase [Meiothermus granaticius NBRC 107808]